MKRVFLMLCVVISASCSSSKFFTSDVKPFEINEMTKIETFSFITLIGKGNVGVLNDSISKKAKRAVNEAVETFRANLRLSSKKIIVKDSLEREKMLQEVDFLIGLAEKDINRKKKKKINYIEITPLVDSLLSVNDIRFGLFIVQDGFTRAKGNYGGQVAKAVGIGILTGILTGTSYYQAPIKANSVLHVLIVDNIEKNVAFYNKSIMQDREPTEKENITKQIHSVFEKYFWDK